MVQSDQPSLRCGVRPAKGKSTQVREDIPSFVDLRRRSLGCSGQHLIVVGGCDSYRLRAEAGG